jgi:anti-sigma B factor antagonist
MDSCQVTVEHDRDCTVVHVRGEVDVATSSLLRDALLCETEETSHVVLDMREMTLIDSTGLSVLVAAQKRFREAGVDLRAVIESPHVLRVLAITGLDAVFTLYPDVLSACGAVAS